MGFFLRFGHLREIGPMDFHIRPSVWALIYADHFGWAVVFQKIRLT